MVGDPESLLVAYLRSNQKVGVADRQLPPPGQAFSVERGMVTAEFAVVLMAVSAVVVLIAFVASVGMSYIQTQDAARQAARLVARGEPAAVAKQQAKNSLPGAKVAISNSGEVVTVQVSKAVSLPVGNLRLPSMTVSSTAQTPKEHDS